MVANKEELPLVLHASDIQEIMKLGRRQLYEFLQDPPFHIERIGKKRIIKILRDVFFRWLEGTQEQG